MASNNLEKICILKSTGGCAIVLHSQTAQSPTVTADNEPSAALIVAGTVVSRDFPVEINWVAPRLAFGGMIGTPENMRIVADAGITHVINLQDEFDDTALVGDTGISVHWQKLGNDIDFSTATIEPALDFARHALDGANNALFVHCLAGRNRSAKITYAVLRLIGTPEVDARERIKQAQPDAVLEDEMLRTLSDRIDRLRA
ncbi:protein-tyrosine phosphatase family protein [Bradyrhizobium diazoefficiens]|uniref:protein-tyrosine phosphatase family protein n=1 Tax=Bradyrhizobium diazoefficiens TaxID=1355477 RepID=UPI0035968ACD